MYLYILNMFSISINISNFISSSYKKNSTNFSPQIFYFTIFGPIVNKSTQDWLKNQLKNHAKILKYTKIYKNRD
jgi:hypothetical protein